MDSQQICTLAAHIRSTQNRSNVFTISTSMLSYLLSSFEMLEEQSKTFQIKQDNSKAELLRDLQFLNNFFHETKTLKLYGDIGDDGAKVTDLTKFKNIVSIEFNKVDVNTVKGLQGLRPQLQKIVCQRTNNSLAEVLSNCGNDQSHSYCWDELKGASFVNNNIVELDQSLECVPWLHTLDLSHNEITNIEALSCLPNLKYLNLSYNKLEVIPQLKGQVCSRLQNLILKNNFIEDISGLRSLTNLLVLDLSNNCLVDHKSLLSLSYLATLQWLNLQNNPLSFHPNHRIRTASYLHLNTASIPFVLNRAAMSKNEKKVVGSYYPLQSKNSSSFATDSFSLASDKVRRVREVVIEEETPVREMHTPKLSASPQQYLETKKQIEILHEKYGESWLNSQSGLLVQNVLGLEGSLPISSSPYEADFTIYSGEFFSDNNKTEKEETTKPEPSEIVDAYDTNEPTTPDIPQDDVDVEEESIYLATVNTETEPIFIVIGQTHISEKECSTGNERARWHIDSIISCEMMEDSVTVQVDFETMRKDRKQRIYIFEEEIEAFVACVKNKINSKLPKEGNDIKYQCMKCSTLFAKIKNESILGEPAVKCPSCDSTLVVEEV